MRINPFGMIKSPYFGNRYRKYPTPQYYDDFIRGLTFISVYHNPRSWKDSPLFLFKCSGSRFSYKGTT